MRSPLKSHESSKLDMIIEFLPEGTRIKVTEDSESPWLAVDIWGKYGWCYFAIWVRTDELYELDRNGAAGDDPIAVNTCLRRVREGRNVKRHK
jgi:hypothetical protein